MLLNSGAKGGYIQAGSHLLNNAHVTDYYSAEQVKMLDDHSSPNHISQYVYANLQPAKEYTPINIRLDMLPFVGHDILLGDNYMDQHKIILDYKTKTIVFGRLHQLATGTNAILLKSPRAWGNKVIRGTANEKEDSDLRQKLPGEYCHES